MNIKVLFRIAKYLLLAFCLYMIPFTRIMPQYIWERFGGAAVIFSSLSLGLLIFTYWALFHSLMARR